MTTASTLLTLASVRDESITVEQLARLAGRSPDFAAGLIDAVEGNDYFAETIDLCESDPMTRREYLDGHAAGQAMLDAESGTVESVPAWTLYPLDPTPCLSDCPF